MFCGYLMTGASDDWWKDGSGGIVPSEASLAHTGSIVDNQSGNLFVAHSDWSEPLTYQPKTIKKMKSKCLCCRRRDTDSTTMKLSLNTIHRFPAYPRGCRLHWAMSIGLHIWLQCTHKWYEAATCSDSRWLQPSDKDRHIPRSYTNWNNVYRTVYS